MGKASNVIRSKFIYIVGVLLIILLLLALIIFTPLKDIFISPQAAPTIGLEIVEGPVLEEASGFYRFVVGAIVSGNPEPEVVFNRNDGIGEMEPNHSLILLQAEDSFLLEAIASNSIGVAETSLEIHALETEEDITDKDDVEDAERVEIETSNDSGVETPDYVDVEVANENGLEPIEDTEENVVNGPPVIIYLFV